MEEREIQDTYEAAFYIMHGAEIVSIRTEPVPYKEINKKLYKNQWFILLKDIPVKCIEAWKTGKVFGNLFYFSRARRKIKRFAYMKGIR